MSERDSFADAADALASAHVMNASLCGPFVRSLPIDGAAVSMLGVPFGSETVCASNTLAGHLDEVQIDLGEGPCWDAKATRRPVLSADIRADGRSAWPIFSDAIGGDAVGALHAFPLTIGSFAFGAIDLFTERTGLLTEEQVSHATRLASIASRQVLREAISAYERQGREEPDTISEFSRRVVHQATGMALVQLDVSAADALLVIRGHAFANGRSVRDVATDIVNRTLNLSESRDGIEN